MINNVLSTLKIIMDSKEISEYRLSQISTVPQSTINSMFKKNNVPSISTLQLLCQGLDLTLVEFFSLLNSYEAIESRDSLSLNDLMVQEVNKGTYTTQMQSILKEMSHLSSDDLELIKNLLKIINRK